TVVNGQNYFYAVTAYDFGSDSLNFYPSENAITVSQRVRGGIILPRNVVQVRPEPAVAGFTRATAEPTTHVAGDGVGTVDGPVGTSTVVPNHGSFEIRFNAPPDSVRATSYSLSDGTNVLFATGRDLRAAGVGPVGAGLQPLVSVPPRVTIDASRTGFRLGS